MCRVRWGLSAGWDGVPELGGASGGGDLGAGRAAGERERGERLLDLVGGAVVLEDVADLAAGQPCRAAWICSASGSPVAPCSAQLAERAA
jgi:hypothetical protein